jgi:UDP-N-acetylmuramyl pentapeptide phosphotransferase/UDP-N-acetylglucosamine-1-phosphate transferase
MLTWCALHFGIGAAGTWLARRYALRRDLLDRPGDRRSHALPTPRGGGIAIAVALLLALLWLWPRNVGADRPMLAATLAGLVLVAGVGLLDDHRPLSPWTRILVHAMAAALLAAGTWLATGDAMHATIAFVLALVLTNVWNFMDGINGLAATQAMLVAGAVAAATDGAAQAVALALLAAVAGFLPFNFPRARIFLGDVGSGALGFSLAALLVAAIGTIPARTWWLWALPLSAFLLDSGLTLFGRVRRGEAWWRPHTQHAYQRWARHAGGHVPVTLGYAIWTGLAIMVMHMFRDAAPAVMPVLTFVWYIAGALVWSWLQRRGAVAASENME